MKRWFFGNATHGAERKLAEVVMRYILAVADEEIISTLASLIGSRLLVASDADRRVARRTDDVGRAIGNGRDDCFN